MKATVCHPAELGPAEIERWRAMQRAHAAVRHPFLSPDFALAFGAAKRTARVAVVEDGNEIVGFLAFDRNALGVARPAGGRLSYRQGFVHSEGCAWSWPELMRRCGIHGFAFTDLIGSQAATAPGLTAEVSPIVDTSIGWDRYLAQARTHGRVKNLLKHGRRLERDLGPPEFAWGPVDPAELTRLVAWKSRQYRRSGWPDPFARAWVRATLDALVDRLDGELRAVQSTLHAAGELLAVELSLVLGDVHAAWFTTYDRDYATYSPGSLCMLSMIEHACEHGMVYVDLARGDEDWKRVFGNGAITVATGFVHDRSVPALVYGAAHSPYRALRSYVVRHPRLRAFARSSLRRVGAMRVRSGPETPSARRSRPPS